MGSTVTTSDYQAILEEAISNNNIYELKDSGISTLSLESIN